METAKLQESETIYNVVKIKAKIVSERRAVIRDPESVVSLLKNILSESDDD